MWVRVPTHTWQNRAWSLILALTLTNCRLRGWIPDLCFFDWHTSLWMSLLLNMYGPIAPESLLLDIPKSLLLEIFWAYCPGLLLIFHIFLSLLLWAYCSIPVPTAQLFQICERGADKTPLYLPFWGGVIVSVLYRVPTCPYSYYLWLRSWVLTVLCAEYRRLRHHY